MFRVILENELKKRGLSIREAAAQMGISHTTLLAARDGTRRIDTKTALIISKWVGVPFSAIVVEADPEAQEKDRVIQAIRIILKAAPDLEQVFIDAASELEAGKLSLGDFRDIVEYGAYKIRIRREQAQKEEQSKPNRISG